MIVTCLFGDPVEQSVSPYMYNYFGVKAGIPYYSHIKIKVPADNEDNLKNAIEAAKFFGFVGINITIPYKTRVLKYLDKLDNGAEIAGMVNAIVNDNGRLVGYNTDSKGAILAIEARLRKIKTKDKVLIFGAGGAARAVTIAISSKNKNITLINRKEDFNLALSLKKDIEKLGVSLNILPLNEENIIEQASVADLIINATRVGMVPNAKESIISKDQFKKINKISNLKNKIFFDVVFNPYTTQFLKLAKKHGAKICQGLHMTIYQGAASFELWTGKKVKKHDLEIIHKIIKNKMGIKN